MRSAARYDSRLGGGPTRTASSASRTCGAAASASEKTVTLRMPMARRVLSTRRAISPRLATRTLWIRRTGASFTGVGARREDPPAVGADLGRARRLAGWIRTRRRLAGQPRSCYQSDGDARRASVLRRRQPAVRYEDAPRAAQSEPRHLDLRRRVAFHPALHARRRALRRPGRSRELRTPGGGAARHTRVLALGAARRAHRHGALVPAVQAAGLARCAGGTLPLRTRAGDRRSAPPLGRDSLGRQDARLHGGAAAARDPLPRRAFRAPGSRPARLRAVDAGGVGQHAAAHRAGVGGSRAPLPGGRRVARPGAVSRAALRGPRRRRARAALRRVRVSQRTDAGERGRVPAHPRESRVRARRRPGHDRRAAEMEAAHVAGAAASHRGGGGRPARRLWLRARVPRDPSAPAAGGADGRLPAGGRLAPASLSPQGAGRLDARLAVPAGALSAQPRVARMRGVTSTQSSMPVMSAPLSAYGARGEYV